jgi:hypothetical protein
MRDSMTFGNPRRLRLLGSIAIAALVGLLLTWALLGGPAEHRVAGSDGDVLAQADEDDTDDTADAVEAVSIEVTYETFLARDPFQSIRPPEPDPPPADPSDPSTPTDPSDPSTPTDPSDPSTPTDPSAPPGGVVMIEVVEVTEGGAQIRIGSTVYAPRVGDTFGDGLRLVRILDNCVELQHGDSLLPILCVGEATAK